VWNTFENEGSYVDAAAFLPATAPKFGQLADERMLESAARPRKVATT
jgi:hypothetical protein